MIDLVSVGRPAGHLLGRFVRITLAGVVYELPTLPIGGNRRWQERLDADFRGLLNGLRDSDKQESTAQVATIFTLLQGQIEALIGLLYAFDTATTAEGVPFHPPILPPREVLEDAVYEDEIVAAVREVWRATNPLVDTSLRALETSAAKTNGSSPPTSLPRRNTAGNRKRSRKN